MLLEIILAVFLVVLGLGALLSGLERSLHYLPSKKSSISIVPLECRPEEPRDPYLLKRCVDPNTKIETMIIGRSDSAFTLSEVLLSISIGLIIVGFLLKTFAIASFHSKTLLTWIREDTIVDRLESECLRLFEVSDSQPFVIPPRIHSGGTILLLDGKPNAVMNGSSKLRPSTQSSALTNSKLAMNLLSDIQDCSVNAKQRSGKACLRYANSASTSIYQSFILVSLDGIFEGQGHLGGQGKCKNFEITLGDSMLFDPPPSTSSCNERLLIPLDFIQTIYQSQQGDYRLITHRTTTNVENQPLTLALPLLKLSLELQSSLEPWRMNLSISKQEKNLLTKQILSVHEKQQVDNFILNNL